MPKVQIKNNQIYAGSKKIPLLSGEVHYWRLNPNYWKEVLARVREMGLKVVSTYIAWDYHEYSRGKFDFTGKTDQTRNLKAFLDLTRKEGFSLIIRPGPYIYSEWPNEGVPAYAHRYHRLHPRFLAYARNYLAKVTQLLRPYQATRRGGHIVLLQADNEIDPWPDRFGNQYGLVGTPGLFQDYLKDLYEGRIQNLNEGWGTGYRSFREAGPFIGTMLKEARGLSLKGDKELRRNIDYIRFKHIYSRTYADWVVRAFRELGMDVPIYLNVYPFFYAHDWSDLQKLSDTIGLDLYPSNEFLEDEFEHRKFLDKIRYLQAVSRIPFIAEFGSGVWHSRHYESGVFTPNHYRLTCLSALLAGAAGWNWYMLVNRDNWYMAPINEWGRTHGELYGVFKQIVSAFHRMDPPSLRRITQVGVTFHPLQHAVKTVPHDHPVLNALYHAGLDYEMCDPHLNLPTQQVVFYAGNQWLDRAAQKNLRRYVEKGGILVAFRDYPRKDENFERASWIGFEEPARSLFEFKRNFKLRLGAHRPWIELTSSLDCFEISSREKIEVDLGNYGKNTIGYFKKVGKGNLLHLGVQPTPELVLEILDFTGRTLGSHSTTADIHTALFKGKNRYYVIAVNNGREDKGAGIHFPILKSLKKKVRVEDVMNPNAPAFSYDPRNPFTVEIPRKDGRIFEFRT